MAMGYKAIEAVGFFMLRAIFISLRLSLLAVFVMSLSGCPTKAVIAEAGDALIVFITQEPLLDKTLNSYGHSEYPATRFFVDAYLGALREQLAAASAETGLALTGISLPQLTAVQNVWETTVLPQFAADSTRSRAAAKRLAESHKGNYWQYWPQAGLTLTGIPAIQRPAVIQALHAALAEKFQYFIALELRYSLVEQRIHNRIIIYDAGGAVLAATRIKVVANTIIRDSASPYLLSEPYLAMQPAAGTLFTELQLVAKELGKQAAAQLVLKLTGKKRGQTSS